VTEVRNCGAHRAPFGDVVAPRPNGAGLKSGPRLLFPRPAGTVLSTRLMMKSKATGSVPKTPERRRKQDAARIRWVFRCNAAINDEPNEVTDREAHAKFLMDKLAPLCTACAFQLESAPSTGYLHYQGCMELSGRKRFDWIQKHIRKFEYLAPMIGTPHQAWNYATKLETRVAGPWTWGEPYGEAKVKPTEEYVKSIFAGATDRELWKEHPSCMARLHNVPHRIRSIETPQRTEELEVYLFYGGAGKGKSRMVRTLYPDVYIVPFGQKVWLTPKGCLAQVVCLEDFDGNMPLKQFNRMIDRYPEEVETKGSHLWWMPQIIFIVSNIVPSKWWPDEGRQDVKEQVFRRINAVYDFNAFSWTKWETNRIMPLRLTVEELENKYYLQSIPKLQIEAQERTKARFNSTGGVMRSSFSSRKLAGDGMTWVDPNDGSHAVDFVGWQQNPKRFENKHGF